MSAKNAKMVVQFSFFFLKKNVDFFDYDDVKIKAISSSSHKCFQIKKKCTRSDVCTKTKLYFSVSTIENQRNYQKR